MDVRRERLPGLGYPALLQKREEILVTKPKITTGLQVGEGGGYSGAGTPECYGMYVSTK